ncbi:MAG: tetratricopeptide repeat protein [Candidatus Omnitrophota bacterium]|nr:MAG: tetratricopeptide repeat protein [Candidatus Omnitrophota bacterium]
MKSVYNKYIPLIVIVLVGFTVYANSLRGQFIWDDEKIVKDNIYIRDFSYLSKIFTTHMTAGAGGREVFYRPVQTFTYLLDYSLWKLNVVGYHLTNTLLHIAVALTLYWLMVLLFGDRILSFLTSIFFVIHPIHTEAVAYISGRADSLAALFMLLCFIFYIKYLDKKSTLVYILMLSSSVCALFSRESTLVLPALLLLYHYTSKKKLVPYPFFSLVGTSLIYILLRVTLLKHLLFHGQVQGTLIQRIPGFFVALTNYLKLLILPSPLHMEYGNSLFSLADPRAIIGVLILVCGLSYIYKVRKKNAFVFFAGAWFFINLSLHSNLYPVGAYMAEHWLYLASIGFFLIVSKYLSSCYRKENFRFATTIVIIILVCIYGTLTIAQNKYWREPRSFYERTLRYAPQSERMYNNLGFSYRAIGRYQDALSSYKKAIELNPKYATAYTNLGLAYYDLGNYQEAVSSYKKALELSPSDARTYNNLAVAYHKLGRNEEAIMACNKALEINPNFVDTYNNLALLYYLNGRYKKAIPIFEKAIKLNPYFAQAYYNLGNVYRAVGDDREAITLYKRAIEIDPNYTKVHRNLAVTYFNIQEYDLAIKHCDRAVELGYKVSPKLLGMLEPHRRD